MDLVDGTQDGYKARVCFFFRHALWKPGVLQVCTTSANPRGKGVLHFNSLSTQFPICGLQFVLRKHFGYGLFKAEW